MLTVPSAEGERRRNMGSSASTYCEGVKGGFSDLQQMKKAAAIAPVVKSWKMSMHLPRMSVERRGAISS